MGNEQLHDKLFQAARQHLKDHEEPFNGSDWDRMDRALDQLPSSRQFRFSFSLNSVLVLVGITGLALGGYALLGGHSSAGSANPVNQPAVAKTAAPAKKENTPSQLPNVVYAEPVKQPAAETKTVAKNDGVSEPATAGYVAAREKRHLKNSTGTTRETAPSLEDAGLNPLTGNSDNAFADVIFPDQIDRRFGPVFETQEDPNRLHEVPTVDPTKLTYYDHVNGQTTPVHIKSDSSKGSKTTPRKNRRSKKNQAPAPEAGTSPTTTGTDGN